MQKSKIMKNRQTNKVYDVIIIGAGPAGLSAALYAIRYKLEILVISKRLGGTLLDISEIGNFPGQNHLKGEELAEIFIRRVKNGVELLKEEVEEISKNKNHFLVVTKKEDIFKSKKVIVSTGVSRKRIGVPGEKEFERKGVSYCALCDAPFFRHKSVVVVGGGNTAFHAAILSSQYAKEVFIIARRKISADPILVDHASKDRKIIIQENTSLEKIEGENFVEQITFSRKIKGKKILKVSGIFVEAGVKPETGLLKKLALKKNREGFLKVSSSMETSITGLFAAGDISTGSDGLRQVVTAVSEGVVAITSIYNELKER